MAFGKLDLRQKGEKTIPASSMPSVAREAVWTERQPARSGESWMEAAMTSTLRVKSQGRKTTMPAAQVSV